eukprot:210030_1
METTVRHFSYLVGNKRELELGGDKWYELSNESKRIIQQGFTKYHEYKKVQNIKVLDIRWTSLFGTEGLKWLIPIITNIPCYIISINITECGLCDDDILLMLNAFDKVYIKQQSKIKPVIQYFTNNIKNIFIPQEVINLIESYCCLYESNIQQIDMEITPKITDKHMGKLFNSIELYFPYLKKLNFRENTNMTDNVCKILKEFFIRNPYHPLQFINFFGKHHLLSAVSSNGLILLNEMFEHNINKGVWNKKKPNIRLLIGGVVQMNPSHA